MCAEHVRQSESYRELLVYPGSNFADETIGQFGNISRNKFYGPSYINTDAAFYKNRGESEARYLQLRLASYNIFNHPNFANPCVNLSGSSCGGFGTIQSTVSVPTSIFGSFVGAAASPRLVQLTAKFDF